ncbi:MAG: LytTR family transcriptional regulator [Parapedobacter sp.]|nr:MAG: LytTR family transcriptional regulator [Parapedobacter sp.]
MRKLISWLTQRHSAHDDPWVYLRTITVISMLVFLILWIFTPFNFRRFPEERQLAIALMYSGTAYLTMSLCLLWIKLLPEVFKAESWTLGREMLLVVYQFTTIALSVWLLTRYLEPRRSHRSYWYTWSIVAAGGILPYLVATSLKHVCQLRKNLREAVAIRNGLSTQQSVVSKGQLTIPSLLVPLSVSEFVFARSDGNYVIIAAEKMGTTQIYTVRSTLRGFLAANAEFGEVFHCHRAFAVNLSHVRKVEGNAAGCFLVLGDSHPPVPVSRAHVARLKQALRESQLPGN